MAKIDFNENGSNEAGSSKTLLREHLSTNEGNVLLNLPDGLASPSRIFESLYHAVSEQLSDDDLKRMARMSEDASNQSIQFAHIFETLGDSLAEMGNSSIGCGEVAALLWGANTALSNIRALNSIAVDAELLLSERAATKQSANHH